MRCRALVLVNIASIAAVAGSAAATTGEWVRPTGGTWWDSSNWSEGVPAAPDDEALFLDTVEGPATITVDGPAALGTFYLSNTSPLLFDGPSRLTLASEVADAFVAVEAGDHAVAAPLHLASATVLHVLEPSVLTISGPLSSGAAIEFAKVSGGSLEISGPQAHGEGSLFIAIDGRTRMGSDAGSVGAAVLAVNVENRAVVTFAADQHLRALRVGGGFEGEDVAPVAVLEQHGGRVIHADLLEVHPTGRLDVTDNALVVRATAETRAAVLAEVEGLIEAARNAAAGLWRGNGITSSTAEARPVTGLAVVLNDRGDGTPLFTTFGGEPVDVNSVIVRHTFNGDANLDGVINSDDYFRIDNTFLSPVANPTYREGDFNFDDRINSDDYFLIDAAFLGQQAGASGGGALQSVVVPEPASATLLATAALCAMRRRRGA